MAVIVFREFIYEGAAWLSNVIFETTGTSAVWYGAIICQTANMSRSIQLLPIHIGDGISRELTHSWPHRPPENSSMYLRYVICQQFISIALIFRRNYWTRDERFP